MSRVGLIGDRVWRSEPCRWNRHDDNDLYAVCPSVKPHVRTEGMQDALKALSWKPDMRAREAHAASMC